MSRERKKRPCILLIEDDELNLELVQTVLEGAGFRVLAAHAADEGIEIARQKRPDAILMDVDNGPNWLALDRNKRLYNGRTLRRIKGKLRQHGILATWSAQLDKAYWKRLNSVFQRTEEVVFPETVHKKGQSVIYLGMASS